MSLRHAPCVTDRKPLGILSKTGQCKTMLPQDSQFRCTILVISQMKYSRLVLDTTKVTLLRALSGIAGPVQILDFV